MSSCFLPLLLGSHDFPFWNLLSFPPIRIFILHFFSSVLLSWNFPNNLGPCFFLPHYTTIYANQCVFCGLLEIPETLSGGPWGQNHFYNNTKMLFVFLIVLTSAMMVQKQWGLKLLYLSTTQQWYKLYKTSLYSSPPHTHRKKKSLHLKMFLMKL